MTHSFSPVSEKAILQSIYDWLRFLEIGDYEGALTMIPSNNINWNPEMLESLINNYGSIEPRLGKPTCRVTPYEHASDEERFEIIEFDNGTILAHYDIPLDGEFSDLTGQFQIINLDGEFTLRLHDIHVM